MRLLVEQVAQRVTDRGGLEEVGRDLVQERLERVVVVLVHEQDVGVGVLELLDRSDAAEPTSQHDDPRPIGNR